MKRLGTKVTAAALALVLGLSPLASASEALGHDIHSGSVELSVGTSLTRQIFWSDTYSDLRTEHYLTYTPNTSVTPTVSYGSAIASRATLTEMAQTLKAEAKRVVGGTNGDYYVVATGTPLGMVITDGIIRSLPGWSDSWYYAVGFRSDGSVVMGQPQFSVTATFNGDLTVSIMGGVNKVRTAEDGYFLFTEDFGSTTLNNSAGVDVVLVPVTDNVGQSVDVDLDVTDPDGTDPTTPTSDDGTADGELSSGELPEGETGDVPEEVSGTLTQSDKLIVNGRVTCVVQQVIETDTATAIAPGTMILSANKQADAAVVQSLLDLEPGDTVDIDITAADPVWTEVQQGMGAMYQLVKDGQVQTGLDSERTARTAIGVKADGTVIFYTIDGKQSGYSVGATFTQVAQRLVELGCVEAVGLDGGGSTTIGATYPDGDSLEVVNSPSDGTQRANSVAVFLTTSLQPTGELSHLYVKPSDSILLAGASVQLETVAVDTAYYAMEAVGQVSYSIQNGDGRVGADGIFTAGAESGVTQVTANLGSAVGSAVMTVVKTPDNVTVSDETTGAALSALSLSPNESIDLKASAIYRNLTLVSQDTCFTWSVDNPEVGTVDENGVFTAGEKSATGNLTVSAGGISATIPVTVAGHILTVDGFEEGVGAFTATDTLRAYQETDGDHVRYGSASARLTYDTSAVGTATLAVDWTIREGERYLGLWVLGDGSGATLKAAVADSQGTVTEVDLGVLDFAGWRHLMAELPTDALSVRTLGLAAGQTAQAGTIWLDQVTTANEYLEDSAVPVVTPSVSGTRLLVSVVDDLDKEMAAVQITVTYDGASLPFTWDGDSRVLTAELPASDGYQHRITVKATDSSGNIGKASLDIEATLEQEQVFLDTAGHWAEDQLLYLYDRGIITGIHKEDGDYFQPDANITRGAFLLMTARWLRVDFTAYESVELPFDDAAAVPEWMLPAVKAMYALGYLKGSSSNGQLLVRAESTITRAEAVTILGRIQEKGYATGELTYDDADQVPSWALSYVQTMTAQGVLSGYDNRIRPNDPIKRSEAAKLFYVLM